MQKIYFKNRSLTIPQKFFIQKSLEMVYHQTIDSYRVRVKNPKSILTEIASCLDAFEAKQITHFQTIAGDGTKSFSLTNEALSLLKSEPNLLNFNAVSKVFFETTLKNLCETNYKKCRKAIELFLNDNHDYLATLTSELSNQLNESYENNAELILLLKKIDCTLGFLFTELVDLGFSKGFLYRKLWGVFINNLTDDVTFEDKFREFANRLKKTDMEYLVIFRADCGKKTSRALTETAQANMEVLSNVDTHLPSEEVTRQYFTKPVRQKFLKELRIFNQAREGRKYLKCTIQSPDYFSALKKAKSILSQNVDIINLGFSDEYLHIHHRILVIDATNPNNADFQTSKQFLDGKYNVTHDYYRSFVEKLPIILGKPSVTLESKEKVKSALRYLRLGNESVEVEHKFINYWIGLEYLFSNYETSNTIKRIKEHFVTAHSLIYVKRNVKTFLKAFNTQPPAIKNMIHSYSSANDSYKYDKAFYQDVFDKQIDHNPLLAYRSVRLMEKMFKTDGNSSLKKYLEKHKHNLLIHFTRIYRMRNEIIHDALTDSNYDQIASNLRYYLTFILNSIIDFLYNSTDENTSIESYFTLNELKLSIIETESYPLEKLLDIDESINFIS